MRWTRRSGVREERHTFLRAAGVTTARIDPDVGRRVLLARRQLFDADCLPDHIPITWEDYLAARM